MENSKLITLLRTFSSKEMRLLSEFVRSPYFNKNETIISFFAYLEKYHPALSSRNLEKVNVFKHLFGKKKFDDVKIRGLISDALELAEEFLALENMKKRGFSKDAFLLNELNLRNLDVLFEIRSKKMQEPKKGSVEDNWYFLNRFLISSEVSQEMWKLNDNMKEKLVGSNIFENTLSHLTQFYVYEGMKNFIKLCQMDDIVKYPNTVTTITDILLRLSENMKDPPAVFNYLKLFQQTTAKDNVAAFQELKHLFLDLAPEILSREDKVLGLDLLADWAIIQYMKGSRDYQLDSWNISKRYVEFGLHLEKGFMEENFFASIIINGVYNKEYEWAETFISENAHHLPAATRADTVAYTRAMLYGAQNMHKETLHHLNLVSSPPLQTNINIKCMMIRSYYGKGDMDMVLNTCRSFAKFLRSNRKIIEIRKESLLLFTDFSSKMAKINAGKLEYDAAEFVKEVERTEGLGLKPWLLRNAQELAEKRKVNG